MKKQPELIIHTQHVRINWNKTGRGGAAAVFRNKLPESYLIEQNPAVLKQYGKIEGHIWSRHEEQYGIWHSLSESEEPVTEDKPFLIRNQMLQATLRNSVLQLWWHDPQWNRVELLATLQPSQWARCCYHCQGGHRSSYTREIFNIFFGYSAQLQADVFLAQQPEGIFRKGYYYCR